MNKTTLGLTKSKMKQNITRGQENPNKEVTLGKHKKNKREAGGKGFLKNGSKMLSVLDKSNSCLINYISQIVTTTKWELNLTKDDIEVNIHTRTMFTESLGNKTMRT